MQVLSVSVAQYARNSSSDTLRGRRTIVYEYQVKAARTIPVVVIETA